MDIRHDLIAELVSLEEKKGNNQRLLRQFQEQLSRMAEDPKTQGLMTVGPLGFNNFTTNIGGFSFTFNLLRGGQEFLLTENDQSTKTEELKFNNFADMSHKAVRLMAKAIVVAAK